MPEYFATFRLRPRRNTFFHPSRSAIEYSRIHQRHGLTETRYQMILEDQTEMVCRFIRGGILTYVNGAYCRYFGIERGSYR